MFERLPSQVPEAARPHHQQEASHRPHHTPAHHRYCRNVREKPEVFPKSIYFLAPPCLPFLPQACTRCYPACACGQDFVHVTTMVQAPTNLPDPVDTHDPVSHPSPDHPTNTLLPSTLLIFLTLLHLSPIPITSHVFLLSLVLQSPNPTTSSSSSSSPLPSPTKTHAAPLHPSSLH